MVLGRFSLQVELQGPICQCEIHKKRKCVQHCCLCANRSKLKCIATSKVKMDTYLIVNAVQLGAAMNHSSYCYSWTMTNNFSIQLFSSLTKSQFSCCIACHRLGFLREVPKNVSPSPSCASIGELQHLEFVEPCLHQVSRSWHSVRAAWQVELPHG